jgi:hypothetical protein
MPRDDGNDAIAWPGAMSRRKRDAGATKNGGPDRPAPRAKPEKAGDYFSPFSTILTLPFRLAWAAASLATGMR